MQVISAKSGGTQKTHLPLEEQEHNIHYKRSKEVVFARDWTPGLEAIILNTTECTNIYFPFL